MGTLLCLILYEGNSNMVHTQGSPCGQSVAQYEWQWNASTWQKAQMAAMAHPHKERDWGSVIEAVCVP